LTVTRRATKLTLLPHPKPIARMGSQLKPYRRLRITVRFYFYQPSAQAGKAPKTVSASPETVLAIPHQSAALGWNGAENRISVAGNHTGNTYQPSTQGWNGAENRISVAGNHTGSRKPYWHPAAFSPVVDQAQASYTWVRLHRFEGGSRHSYAGVCESQHLQGVLHSAWIYILS
jgi:hypothetical protein